VTSGIVDHGIHGLVSIRLLSPPPELVDRMRAVFGPSDDAHSEEPDVVVSFVDDLRSHGELRVLGLNDAAFDDDSFYVLDGLGRRTRLDFRALGDPCRLECERGITSIPLLLQVISLRLLRKGHVLLHASAFVDDGRGVLATGWEKGGKTELLLAFVAEGARYLADEWTIVSTDGTIRGLAGNPSIWDWHARSLPQYWSRLARRDRARLTLLRLYRRLYGALPDPTTLDGVPRQVLHRLSLEGGISAAGAARPLPGQLFGENRVERRAATLERILFASAVRGGTSVRPVEPEEVAARMVASQRYERRALLAAYDHFRFAFPERRNTFLEEASESERRLLLAAFAGRPAFDVRHPYPVPLRELYEVVRPALEPSGGF
jgi:hypothetical protein